MPKTQSVQATSSKNAPRVPTGTDFEERTRKGAVSIEALPDRGLRLRWSYAGKRFVLSTGLPDSKVNRQAAKHKATQIELDIASGNFDPTLVKYKPESEVKLKPDTLKLWLRFTEHKAHSVLARTIEGTYQPIAVKLSTYGKPIYTPQDAQKFSTWLTPQISENWARRMLVLLNACYSWAIEQDLATINPFKGLAKTIRVPTPPRPQPFSTEEIGAIQTAFDTDLAHRPYANFVRFLFATGCRTGEAVGLRWGHLSPDCKTVTICESLSGGVRKKTTKTGRSRIVSLTDSLASMLRGMRPAKPDPEALVLTSAKGKAIDTSNFRNCHWVPVLKRLEIDYRKPYTTRSSLISHALDLGMNPVAVAQLTGHSVETLYSHYAGNVNSKTTLPEL